MMDVTLTLMCNNRCSICARRDYLSMIACRSKKDMARAVRAARHHSDNIVLSGGEATLLKNLKDVVLLCRALKFTHIGLISNGRLLKNMPFAVELADSGIDDFAISLHSFDEEVHDEMTRRPGSARESKKGVRNLLKLSEQRAISFRINLVLAKANAETIPCTIRRLSHWGVNNFILAEQIILAGKNQNTLSLEEIRMRLEAVNDIALEEGVTIRLRGFAPCLMPGKIKKFLSHEPHNVNTFEKPGAKKNAYLRSFQNIFTKTDECRGCHHNATCPGLQKGYLHI
ncbi:MAG TPA: hypothetical protein DCL35_02620 [Candidatus Omnitrophica bacterium]|nr:hypothetical protein [Candidatus Omnitrophota bacterium]